MSNLEVYRNAEDLKSNKIYREFKLDNLEEDYKNACNQKKKQYRQKYEHTRRKIINKEKITCECGRVISRGSKYKHKHFFCKLNK